MAEPSNECYTMMHSIWEILDKVDPNLNKFSVNAVKLGKLIKRQRLKSKHTLGQSEIHYYTKLLVEVFKNWADYGHRDWKVRQRNPSTTFTVLFERKD
ncbi:hypothetical protein KAU43_01450 [candidate division WOR-3 bacterium]|nr:hypothetical protein [candidate division WOR-3 bacterium]